MGNQRVGHALCGGGVAPPVLAAVVTATAWPRCVAFYLAVALRLTAWIPTFTAASPAPTLSRVLDGGLTLCVYGYEKPVNHTDSSL